MHEHHIIKNILNTVLKQAEKNNLSKITAIRIEAGNLTALTQESMQAAFDLQAVNTIAEGAVIELRIVDGTSINIINFDAE